MTINEALANVTEKCECGKEHTAPKITVESGGGAVNTLQNHLKKFNCAHPFVISDNNTELVAGKQVKDIIKQTGKNYTSCLLDFEKVVPDEKSVGYTIMNYSADCDIIISVGSGVINDIGKIVSNVTGKPYILIATAPSMDGFASLTSSMEVKNLKISLPSRAADVVIGDTDILKTAPDILLQAGLGDILAKCISICEWRISNIVTGEYYCEKTAQLVRNSLKACVDNAEALMRREDNAVQAVFEALVLSGIAMNLVGASRPASGIEHYYSHIFDMRSLCFNIPTGLHGINCAIGTFEAYQLYQKLLKIKPDKEKALKYTSDFDLDSWHKKLGTFIGKGSKAMIEAEITDGKYNLKKHSERLNKIINNWDIIIGIIEEELPSSEDFAKIYKSVDLPSRVEQIGLDESILPMTFLCTKDVRNKYILSSLCWDLGIIEDIIK